MLSLLPPIKKQSMHKIKVISVTKLTGDGEIIDEMYLL